MDQGQIVEQGKHRELLKKKGKYFELYKKIPEYQKINYGMSLDEFKIIFWWEYIHRVLARILVLAYIIPLIFFVFRSYIDKTKIFFFSSIFFLY